MWPLLERVIEVWCCRMPSDCQSGWFLTVWTRATVPRCHNVRTGQLLCPRRRRPLSNVATARGHRGMENSFNLQACCCSCCLQTSWGCFSWRIKFSGPEPNATRVCVGFVLNLNLTKCKILCTLKTDWLLILEWIWMEILFSNPAPPARCHRCMLM